MEKISIIKCFRLAAAMAAAACFCLFMPACGDGGGSTTDADAEVPLDQPAEEGESIGEVPGEDIPHDPVQDEAAGDTAETADVPIDDYQDADASDSGCTPPLVYHPAFGICVSTEGIGDDCADTGECNTGQQCVTYTGIAGIEFHECYIPCGPGPENLCPVDWWCPEIADGPQHVCMGRD